MAWELRCGGKVDNGNGWGTFSARRKEKRGSHKDAKMQSPYPKPRHSRKSGDPVGSLRCNALGSRFAAMTKLGMEFLRAFATLCETFSLRPQDPLRRLLGVDAGA